MRDLLDDLETRHPGLRDRVVDEKGVRRFVNVFVNEEDVRFLDRLDTPLSDGDVVSLIPAVAGGSTDRATAEAAGIDYSRQARQIALADFGVEGQRTLATIPVTFAPRFVEAEDLHVRAGGVILGENPRLIEVELVEAPCATVLNGLAGWWAVEAARRLLGDPERKPCAALMQRLGAG